MENSPQHVNAEVSTRKWAGRGKKQDHHDGIKKHILRNVIGKMSRMEFFGHIGLRQKGQPTSTILFSLRVEAMA